MLILQGILVQSLNRYCIRGVAKLSELEQLSTVDKDYQRNLIETQRKEMEEFLEGPDLFFPEVLLSYHFKGGPLDDQIALLQEGKKIGKSSDPIRFRIKPVATQANGVVQPTVNYVTIEIDEVSLGLGTGRTEGIEPKYPFFRIDGNHRLSAAANLKKDSTIGDLNTPFCLLLLLGNTAEQEIASRSFERTVFYNVNSKSVPLTREEILRVVVDQVSGITDDDLANKFSAAHLYTRKQFAVIQAARYPSLDTILHGQPGEKRRILWELYGLLADYEAIPESNNLATHTDDTFRRVERLYTEQPRLGSNRAVGLLLAFLFYSFRASEKGGVFRFEYFSKWVLQNHFSEIGSIEAESLIKLFEQVFTTKRREIFVSMPFSVECNVHYKAFEKVVNEINAETKDPLPLKIRRIDRRIDGVTYQISEKILEEIRTAGLLIADLSLSNENVYHEVGYLMGVVAHDPLQSPNMIFVCNTSKTDFPKIGFNLRGYKTLGFKDTGELTENLKREVKTYYYPEI